MKVRAIKGYSQRRIKWMICLSVIVCCLNSGIRVEASENAKEPMKLDNFSGEVISDTGSKSSEIRVFSDCVYDVSTQKFVYTVDAASKLQVVSTVADGMVVNHSVSFETDRMNDFSLFKNGTKVENADLTSINESGSYVLLYKGAKVLEFRIVGEYSTIEVFYTPTGFSVHEVLLDGTQAHYDYDSVAMDVEGTYEVTYVCEATGKMYSFETTVDRTAPVLVLEELDEKGRAKGPVDISDREENSILEITVNGEELEATDSLTQSGQYIVKISDQAGNYNVYQFTIMLYFNSGSRVFTGLILAVAAGMAAYIVISAKRLKVF